MELHEKIKRLRIEKEWTQKDMSDKLGFTSITGYQKIENGKTSLTIDRLKQIANLFEVDFFELLGANSGGSDCTELERENKELRIEMEYLHKKENLYQDSQDRWDMMIHQNNRMQELYKSTIELHKQALSRQLEFLHETKHDFLIYQKLFNEIGNDEKISEIYINATKSFLIENEDVIFSLHAGDLSDYVSQKLRNIDNSIKQVSSFVDSKDSSKTDTAK